MSHDLVEPLAVSNSSELVGIFADVAGPIHAEITKLEAAIQVATVTGQTDKIPKLEIFLKQRRELLTLLNGDSGAPKAVVIASSPVRSPEPAASVPIIPSSVGPTAVVRTSTPRRPLEEITSDVCKALGSVNEVFADRPLRIGDTWDTPQMIRVRAFYCLNLALTTEVQPYVATHPYKEDGVVYERLQSTLANLREVAVDREYCVAWDQNHQSGGSWPLQIAEWRQFHSLYMRLAEAWEAMTWLFANQQNIGVDAMSRLLNSISARQQLMFRFMTNFTGGSYDSANLKEPCQRRLNNQVYQFNRNGPPDREERCYLPASRLRCPMHIVQDASECLPRHWQRAKEELAQKQSLEETAIRAKENEETRTAAIQALEGLVTEPYFTQSLRRKKNKPRLFDAMRELQKAGVPPSHPDVRVAITHLASWFAAESEFTLFVREITLEQERISRQQEVETSPGLAPEDDALPDSQMQGVLQYLKNKHLLILGGRTNHQAVKRLKRAFELSQVMWPQGRINANITAFTRQVHQADVMVVLTRMCNDDWTKKDARDLAESHQTAFVLVNSGYGVNNIAHAIYEQVMKHQALVAHSKFRPKR